MKQILEFIGRLWRRLWRKKPKSGTADHATFISYEGNQMERYRLPITPSPDDFVETVEFHAKVNGGAEQTLAAGLPSNTLEHQDLFETGSTIEWWARWIGDNGQTADSNHDTFTAVNLAPLRPGTALAAEFVEHLA